MRVAMMVQLIDEEDWLRGFIVTWVRRLAARVDHLDVITLEDRGADLPDNVTVHSMGKEHGHGRLRELLAFLRILRQVAPTVDVLFSHMTPRYTWLAAPFAAWLKRPQVMWFVHRQVSAELRLAYWTTDRIVTASGESFSLPDTAGKVRVLGHGIDTTVFAPRAGEAPAGRVILYVGRLAPIKNQDVVIEAFARLVKRPGFDDVRLALAGADMPPSGASRSFWAADGPTGGEIPTPGRVACAAPLAACSACGILRLRSAMKPGRAAAPLRGLGWA